MSNDYYDYYLPDDEYNGSQIVKAIDLTLELTDLELVILFRNKPHKEIQELFDKQIDLENYETANQIKRVVNLLNSKVCKYHLSKPLILKVKTVL